MRTRRGFTLVEMLVVIGIFSLIGLISIRLLSQSMQVSDLVNQRAQTTIEIQRAMNILQRDIQQFQFRRIRDEYGDPKAALLVDRYDGLEFTRGGWSNPLGHMRSDLQRVRYYLNEDLLYREYWQSLDRPSEPQVVTQLLLSGISGFYVSIIDRNNGLHEFWPLDAELHRNISPVGLRLALDIERFGSFEWTFTLPERKTLRSNPNS